MEGYYDTQKSIEAQKKFCASKGFPNFAGNGRCFSCGYNVFSPLKHPDGHVTGYTVEMAEKELVIGCPHCHRSFCD